MAHTPIVVEDEPRYKYRGMMLDTARRFYKVSTILHLLDSMAVAKFNVLHWHIVDDQSFPMELKTSFPSITFNGAWSADQVYTQKQIKQIVDHAMRLGIRVVPEFDNPGHTRAVGMDPYFREIVRCFDDWEQYNVPAAYKIYGYPHTSTLDPSYEKTYELLSGVFKEMDKLFPESLIHLGGDEVDTKCFDENANLQTWMNQQGIANYSELVITYLAKARTLLSPAKRAIYWSDEGSFYQRYKDGDVLMYWGSSKNMNNLTTLYPKLSYILSPVDYYYLDCSFGNPYGGNSWCDPMKTWWRIYSFEPSDFLPQEDPRVLGTEVPIWSEIMNEDALFEKIWPRAAAMADKIWAPKSEVDLVSLVQRQVAFRDYINARGIPATFISGVWCEMIPEHCFAKHVSKSP